MGPILIVCQIAAALGLRNVWLLRSHRATSCRGGNAGSMREEFAAYGLPAWSVVVGVLMLGALAMHWKVRDPLKKSLPALAMLALAVTLVLGSDASRI